jgi:spore cortex formation protein SpoVR/YcgB (stage V sporulation)
MMIRWSKKINIKCFYSNAEQCGAAITAYARIHKSKFKNNNQFTLFYTDTDSIAIDQKLDRILVGTDLGKMKLEYIFDKAVL